MLRYGKQERLVERMNCEQLEAFVYTIYLKSANKAAKALYISQPTVTARIQSLEKELDRELFDRQGKSLTLNHYGQEFFKYAQQILQMFREGKEQLQKEIDKQEIRVGANIISSQYLLPAVLKEWEHDQSTFKYHVQATTNDELLTKLLNQELDLAIMRAVESERIQQRLIMQNKIELAVYPDHPFASKESIQLSELKEEPLVFFACGAFDWDLIYKLFETDGVQPFIKYYVDHFEVAKSFIKSKSSIGFLPELCMQQELNRNELQTVKIETFPILSQPIYLSTLKGKKTSKQYDKIASSLLNFDRYIELINN